MGERVDGFTKMVYDAKDNMLNVPRTNEGNNIETVENKAIEAPEKTFKTDSGYKLTDTPTLKEGVAIEKIDTPREAMEEDVFNTKDKKSLKDGVKKLDNDW